MKKTKLPFSLLFKWSFRIILFVLTIYYISTDKGGANANFISNGIVILFTSFIPDIICLIFKFNISTAIDFLIQSFIFMTLFMGKMYRYYSIWPLWDFFLHWLSGVILGFIALTALKPLASQKIYPLLPPALVSVFMFLFSATVAALWEFWEFAGDQLFGFDSQLFSLIDTMSDMISGSIGALIAAFMGYLFIKKGSFKFLEGFVNGASKKQRK
ncbi:MAG: hypothetical protein RR844_03260 [Clostridium sp.]